MKRKNPKSENLGLALLKRDGHARGVQPCSCPGKEQEGR
jgi:hypothetical protein